MEGQNVNTDRNKPIYTFEQSNRDQRGEKAHLNLENIKHRYMDPNKPKSAAKEFRDNYPEIGFLQVLSYIPLVNKLFDVQANLLKKGAIRHVSTSYSPKMMETDDAELERIKLLRQYFDLFPKEFKDEEIAFSEICAEKHRQVTYIYGIGSIISSIAVVYRMKANYGFLTLRNIFATWIVWFLPALYMNHRINMSKKYFFVDLSSNYRSTIPTKTMQDNLLIRIGQKEKLRNNKFVVHNPYKI